MTNITIRIDDNLKQETKEILDILGLTITDAIRLYFIQIVKRKAIPFNISINLSNDE